MKYSVLIHESKLNDEKLEVLQKIAPLFIDDPNCSQIVIGCDNEAIMKLSSRPISKSMFVPMERFNYMALFRGLKAVKEEIVLVIRLNETFNKEEVEKTLEALSKYPAISNKDIIQGFDTRLLMFSLQVAIEMNFAINSYGDVVKLADTPIQYI
ncbi:MAG: hypothetical protein KBT48_10750 [Firmicutes bacterium]|nr:hypothetical protein [Bacillota bacterium]